MPHARHGTACHRLWLAFYGFSWTRNVGLCIKSITTQDCLLRRIFVGSCAHDFVGDREKKTYEDWCVLAGGCGYLRWPALVSEWETANQFTAGNGNDVCLGEWANRLRAESCASAKGHFRHSREAINLRAGYAVSAVL
jgi:hypothetical protein